MQILLRDLKDHIRLEVEEKILAYGRPELVNALEDGDDIELADILVMDMILG